MNNDSIIKELRSKFGFIAHKGIQCDEITLDNLEQFLLEKLDQKEKEIREETIKDIKTIIEKKLKDMAFYGNVNSKVAYGYDSMGGEMLGELDLYSVTRFSKQKGNK